MMMVPMCAQHKFEQESASGLCTLVDRVFGCGGKHTRDIYS